MYRRTGNIRIVATTSLIAFFLLAPASHAQNDPTREEWISLFNGRDLEDWIVKIRGHETGVNFGSTFRVEDGVIKVRYDKYAGFNEQFGHLFYKTSFSH